MNKVEASGRTTEEALRAAARQLGATIDDLEYEVIEEGSKGFFGIGQTPTVVRAWLRRVPLREQEAKQPVAEQAQPEIDEKPEIEAPIQAESEAEPEAERETQAEPGVEPVVEGEPELEAHPAPDAAASAVAERLVQFLQTVLEAMGVEAKARVRSASKEEIQIDIDGKDVAILIGRRGQTLDALQYLCGVYASREFRSTRRIILDAEGYRQRHKEMLERKALDYARAAVEARKEVVLEPQPARDRRIIHLALANHPDVYTYSEGEGDQRHVVISPKK